MTIWFTSDTHFGHNKIIAYCERNVENVEQMNEVLIQNWNLSVHQGDEVYHLGDFSFCGKAKTRDIIKRLNGQKFLIRGNHDRSNKTKWWEEAGFAWAKDYFVLNVHDSINGQQYHQPIILFHFPILSWDRMSHGSWHLHGHTHDSLPPFEGCRMDIGVDTNYLRPYSYETIKERMATKGFVKVDHHG